MVIDSEGLVYRVTAGGLTLPEGANGAGNVHPAGDGVLPNPFKGFEEGLFTRFRIDIGGATIEITCANAMADGLRLAAQRHAVLGQVAAAGSRTSHVDENTGELQILRLPRGAIQLDKGHYI